MRTCSRTHTHVRTHARTHTRARYGPLYNAYPSERSKAAFDTDTESAALIGNYTYLKYIGCGRDVLGCSQAQKYIGAIIENVCSPECAAPPKAMCNSAGIPKRVKRKVGQDECCTEGREELATCPGPAHYHCGAHTGALLQL